MTGPSFLWGKPRWQRGDGRRVVCGPAHAAGKVPGILGGSGKARHKAGAGGTEEAASRLKADEESDPTQVRRADERELVHWGHRQDKARVGHVVCLGETRQG